MPSCRRQSAPSDQTGGHIRRQSRARCRRAAHAAWRGGGSTARPLAWAAPSATCGASSKATSVERVCVSNTHSFSLVTWHVLSFCFFFRVLSYPAALPCESPRCVSPKNNPKKERNPNLSASWTSTHSTTAAVAARRLAPNRAVDRSPAPRQ